MRVKNISLVFLPFSPNSAASKATVRLSSSASPVDKENADVDDAVGLEVVVVVFGLVSVLMCSLIFHLCDSWFPCMLFKENLKSLI